MANLKLIRNIAKEKGLSIRSLAQTAGITEGQLHHLMKLGSTNTQTLETIARVLEVPVGIFFDDLPEDPSQDQTRIEELERENNHLRELLEEKERTIKILMELKNNDFNGH